VFHGKDSIDKMHKLFAPFEFLSSAFPLGKNWKKYYNREYSVPWEVVDENNQDIQ
jgi:hypothetical protein